MSRVYKSLCSELDNVSANLIHLTEKYIMYKIQIEKRMESGYVNMAKARYIMGNKCVSSLQIPKPDNEAATRQCEPDITFTDIKPISTLLRAEHKQHCVFKLHQKEIKSKTRPTNVDDNVQEDGEEENSNERAVRKSVLTKDSSELEEEDVEVVDPIRWFGVLVPQPLRSAQQSFTEALKLAANIATLQSELNQVMARHKHLTEVKKLVEQATEHSDLDIYMDYGYGKTKKNKVEATEVGEEGRIDSKKSLGSSVMESKDTTVTTYEGVIEDDGSTLTATCYYRAPGVEGFEEDLLTGMETINITDKTESNNG